MKDEKIYSIPVTEAFEKDCECPVCAMYNRLEQDAVIMQWDQAIWRQTYVKLQTEWDSAGSI